MRKEYNLLTKKLLKEGYTAEQHPDYVKVCRSAWGKELWQNLAGGFEYTNEHLEKMVFKTGCGLLVKGGRFATGSMSYMGIDWIPENDNPVANCPYRKECCDLKDPVLGGQRGGAMFKIVYCDCHQTTEPYKYEKSLEKVHDDKNRESRRKYEAFVKSRGGHVCRWHTRYNEWTGEWEQDYDPMICAENCIKMGRDCDLTHKPVSEKKGNVFYDVKTSHVRRDGMLFDGEKIVQIEKGVRLFKTAKSMTICEEAARKCKGEIERRERSRKHAEILINGWEVEVLNVRAERRESRDLAQDLQDIAAGIEITHASDNEKKKREKKRERRKQAEERKVRKLEKKILKDGYESLEEYSLDRRHADKWLGEERILELEEIRRKKIEEEKNQPRQISLFEFWGMEEGKEEGS